jgi:hypothetical protein
MIIIITYMQPRLIKGDMASKSAHPGAAVKRPIMHRCPASIWSTPRINHVVRADDDDDDDDVWQTPRPTYMMSFAQP